MQRYRGRRVSNGDPLAPALLAALSAEAVRMSLEGTWI